MTKQYFGMIYERDGNAIDFAFEDVGHNVLLHVVNCQNEINTGIAKEIIDRMPHVEKVYHNQFVGLEGNIDAHGSISIAKLDAHPTIINLYAQDKFGYDGKRYLDYGALASCMAHVRDYINHCVYEEGHIPRIVMPYEMGCARAGGDWTIVSEIIEHMCFNMMITACKIKEL